MEQVWSMVCLAGLWGWLASTAGFILAAFPARGSFAARRSLPWGVAFLLFFALWLLGMSRA